MFRWQPELPQAFFDPFPDEYGAGLVFLVRTSIQLGRRVHGQSDGMVDGAGNWAPAAFLGRPVTLLCHVL